MHQMTQANMDTKCLIVQVWESLLSRYYMNWQRKKTDISVNEKKKKSQIMSLEQKAYTRSVYLLLPAWAAELSGGGWMSPGPPHVKRRSYCSVEREGDGAFGAPSADPHPQPPSPPTHPHQLQPKIPDTGRGCGLFGHSWWTCRRPWQRSDCIGSSLRTSASLTQGRKKNEKSSCCCILTAARHVFLLNFKDFLRGNDTLFVFFIPLQHIKPECSI